MIDISRYFCLVSLSRFRQFLEISNPHNPRKFCRKIRKAVSASACIGHLEIFLRLRKKIDSGLFLRYTVKDCFPLPYRI